MKCKVKSLHKCEGICREFSWEGYYCTRQKGHKGKHHSHMLIPHGNWECFKIWSKEEVKQG